MISPAGSERIAKLPPASTGTVLPPGSRTSVDVAGTTRPRSSSVALPGCARSRTTLREAFTVVEYPDGSEPPSIATSHGPGAAANENDPSLAVLAFMLTAPRVMRTPTFPRPSPASVSTRPIKRAGAMATPKRTSSPAFASTRDSVVKDACGSEASSPRCDARRASHP